MIQNQDKSMDAVVTFADQGIDALLIKTKEQRPTLEIDAVVESAVGMFSQLSRKIGGRWTELDNWAAQNKKSGFSMDLVVMPEEKVVAGQSPTHPFYRMEMRMGGQEILVHTRGSYDADALQFLRINPGSLSEPDRQSFIAQIKSFSESSEDSRKFIKALEEGADMDYWAPWRADSTGIRWSRQSLPTVLKNSTRTSQETLKAHHNVSEQAELNERSGLEEMLAAPITSKMSTGFETWGKIISQGSKQ